MEPADRFRYLVVAALVDGCLQDSERKMLPRLAKKLGLAPAEAGRIILDVADQGARAPLHPLENVRDPRALFSEIVRVLVSDDHLSSEEAALLKLLSRAFGITTAEVGIILQNAMAGEA